MKRSIVVSASVLACLAPASALAAPKKPAPKGPENGTVRIQVGHLHGGKAQIMSTVPVTGSVTPYVAGQRVDVTFYLNGHRVDSKTVKVSGGSFEARIRIEEAGKYAVSAHVKATDDVLGDTTPRKSWRVSFPSISQGKCGPVVRAFKKEMAKMGYVSGGGPCFNGRTAREVLAYRKVNGMARNQHAGQGLVKLVFAGKGGYEVQHPAAGEHAEVPLSKQVLVLAKGDRPYAIYPVSTGKPSTPTITGRYSFYRQEPGYNSEGMYYSFYWHNGYAVHGYAEVPDYAASHGCVRTFIADQPRIYEQLKYGEPIFVF